jgi:cytochrome c553
MTRFTQLLVLLILILSIGWPATARKPIRNAFFGLYPTVVDSVLDELPSNANHCGVCHFDFDGGGPRNAYGFDVEVALNSGLSNTNAILSIENNDSDGDGFTNLTEITDLIGFSNTPTFPGLSASNVGDVLNVNVAEINGHLTPSGGTDTIPPVVTVLSPNGAENLDADSTVAVTWTATDASGISRIDIFMSDDGGLSYKQIAMAEADDGSFDWFVHNLPGSQTIIRVRARDGAGNWGEDASDAAFTIVGLPAGRVPTTLRDMHFAGSQPFSVGPLYDPDLTCVTCHGNYDPAVESWYQWKGSMMGQAQRDPIYLACLAVAEQDAPSVGDLCLRCHTPGGWLEGRSVDTGGGLMNAKDRQGVQCDFCHRLVDPIYKPGISPAADTTVLAALDDIPLTAANGSFVVDPNPFRRGPYADADASHAFLESPLHRSSDQCATCHDVSNPVFNAGATPGDYVPNTFDAEHDDGDLRNMFPIERTFSEYSQSEYATTGVFAPQFAGDKPDGIVSTCQDCHMKDVTGKGSSEPGSPTRSDLGMHDLTGGNTCMPDLIAAMFPGEVDVARLNAGKARAEAMLQLAASLALVPGQDGADLTLAVTVTNETGHKLPSGYPEGRRIWLHVRAYDSGNALVYESGAYDMATGILTHDDDAKIYEIKPGISPGLSPIVGLPIGPSFHFVINDTVFFDNRIPPRGFTNAAFETIQSPAVAYSYADGQYWDETMYVLPSTATFAEVTLYYQTTSKEYVEFLRDENVTNSAGQDLYDGWVAANKCPPVAMATDTTSLTFDATGIQPVRVPTALYDGAPNPFTNGTSIRYSLEHRQPVTIQVYDVAGRLVQTLVDEVRPDGIQNVRWDGTNHHGVRVASGVYYCRMVSGTFESTRKMVLIR